MQNHTAFVSPSTSLKELTLRGIILGALITIIFTASNIYLGLKVGMTISSSIPAAVISMAVFRFFNDTNILENNMVQTQASAAGTLSSIIFILPGLMMIGYWRGFPFWQTMFVCAAGGILGVMFSIPLRHALVVKSHLPYPEGVAAAEILKVGSATRQPNTQHETSGAQEIVAGGLVAALVSFATNGLRILEEGYSYWFSAGKAVFQLPIGFSVAMLGAGYLIGIVSGIAILIGVLLTWGIAVPWLATQAIDTAGMSTADIGWSIWATKARFIGAGVIAIAAVWTLLSLLKPMIEGVKASFRAVAQKVEQDIPRTEQDLSPKVIIGITLVMLIILFFTFHSFIADASFSSGIAWGLVLFSVVFSFSLGFLIAAACGYMAGLVGSSASPISGIAIIAITLSSLLLLLIGESANILGHPNNVKFATALAIFTTSVVVAVATISNDNLQDLKTGWLVGATPWRQEVTLLIGCVVGAMVIPPILALLHQAYGFAGAMPRPDMDTALAMSAPQATLMTTLAAGIFNHNQDWSMILLGIALGIIIIFIDALLARRQGAARLPALAVGLGIYLPPSIGTVLFIGALLSWIVDYRLKKQAPSQLDSASMLAERAHRKGVLLSSGLIVGESLIGVLMALVIVISASNGGSDAPLAIASRLGLNHSITSWLGLAVFIAICIIFIRRVLASPARQE